MIGKLKSLMNPVKPPAPRPTPNARPTGTPTHDAFVTTGRDVAVRASGPKMLMGLPEAAHDALEARADRHHERERGGQPLTSLADKVREEGRQAGQDAVAALEDARLPANGSPDLESGDASAKANPNSRRGSNPSLHGDDPNVEVA